MAEGNYTGIVLAGGKNSRMGREKGMIQWKGRTLAEHAVNTLLPLCSELLISSNGNHYDSLGYPVIKDSYKDCGPMGGILSSLEHSDSELNIVIPVDMPFLTTDIYLQLLKEADGNQDIIVAVDYDSWYQPLCSVFRSSIIPAMTEQVIRKEFGFTPLIRRVRSSKVHFHLEKPYCNEMTFYNVNSPADLEALS